MLSFSALLSVRTTLSSLNCLGTLVKHQLTAIYSHISLPLHPAPFLCKDWSQVLCLLGLYPTSDLVPIFYFNCFFFFPYFIMKWLFLPNNLKIICWFPNQELFRLGGCNSLIEHPPNMYKTLALILSTETLKNRNSRIRNFELSVLHLQGLWPAVLPCHTFMDVITDTHTYNRSNTHFTQMAKCLLKSCLQLTEMNV